MNYRSILFFLGILSILVSFFSILNVAYSVYFDFIIGLNSYLITFLTSLLIGGLFLYLGKDNNKDISLTEQITFILLSFIFIPLLLGIPYYLSIYNFNLLNAYFESVSGFTTTGYSVFSKYRSSR